VGDQHGVVAWEGVHDVPNIVGKQELIRRVAAKAGKSTKETTDLVNATLETIRESLEAGDDVRLVGFGAFSVRRSPARIGVHPQTREKIQIPARQRVKFTPGKPLFEILPGESFEPYQPTDRPKSTGKKK
jgi:nucleoid DNA-binding protein